MAVQLGHGIADRIGNIDGGGTLGNHGLADSHQEVHVAAVAVFGAEFDIGHQVARKSHRAARLLQYFFRAHAQLHFHVQRAGGNEGVDARPFAALQRIGGAADVAIVGACQRTDGGVLDGVGNGLDALEIAVGAGGKAGLDHVHAQAFQLARNADLLVTGHGRAGRLLAITQGGIENDELVGHGVFLWLAVMRMERSVQHP